MQLYLTNCQLRVNKKRRKGKKVYECGRSLYVREVEEHAEEKENRKTLRDGRENTTNIPRQYLVSTFIAIIITINSRYLKHGYINTIKYVHVILNFIILKNRINKQNK